MTEPTSTAAAAVTLAAASASIPVLTILGIPLGLRADLLIAGFAGGIAAIGLLNSVPGSDDTWREMIKLGRRRIFVAVCSALSQVTGSGAAPRGRRCRGCSKRVCRVTSAVAVWPPGVEPLPDFFL